MPRKHKYTGILMSVAFGVAAWLFFALRYPYHLHFQEQYQLFESTWSYFGSVVSVPGGFADWTGRFVTQFFYYAPLGAVLTALLLTAVQVLAFAVCSRKAPWIYALSFVPAFLMAAFFMDENALSGAAVAMILSLLAALLASCCRKPRPRHMLECLLVVPLYFLCGSVAVIFVLVQAVREFDACGKKAMASVLVMAVLLALCPFVFSRLVPYPLGRLVTGVHYYRYHNVVPALMWLSVLSVFLLALSALSCKKGKEGSFLAGVAVFAAVAAAGCTLCFKSSDSSKEEWMEYDFLVRMQMWNRLMLKADASNPDNPKTVSCLNLALARTGRLPGSQFSYFQNGPEGLIPEFVGDHINPVSTSEIYWHLGMVNTAQSYTFEAQEAIPDFQKSARFYKRLAETNIVNGDDQVARKYLKSLTHAHFYRKWARETLALMDAGTIFRERPELQREREWRLKEHDFLFSADEMDSMLGLLRVENPANSMSLDYLMAWCLLKKDLDRFVECLSLVDADVLPKSYQEALLLRWVLTHPDFDGLPDYLSPSNVRRMSNFIADARAGKDEADMSRTYGDTYWFYFYYRYRAQ